MLKILQSGMVTTQIVWTHCEEIKHLDLGAKLFHHPVLLLNDLQKEELSFKTTTSYLEIT